MGKSDPYLEILRKNTDGSWQVVHRTEVKVKRELFDKKNRLKNKISRLILLE